MKIALIGTTLFGQGAEFVLAAIARGFSAKGHDVTVILSKFHEDWQAAHPEWVAFELPAAVNVIVQRKHRGRECVFSLRQILAEGNFDVVMCHAESFTYPLVLASFFLKKHPVLIHVEHSGSVGVDTNGNLLTKPRFSLSQWMKFLLKRCMAAQFAVSEGTANAIVRMAGYPRERVFTVYNPVIDDVYKKKLLAEPEHHWLRSGNLPVVVAAGAFCALKNHGLLLLAWAKVLESFKARLIIFGEGGLRSQYENLIEDLGISDSVSLPGFTDNLPAALKHAACFVVSSKIESFSIVLVEALAAGTPVVSTDCPYGPSEILHGGEYGILVKNNDVDALAGGILKVLQGGGIRPTPVMVAPYTIESIVDRYEEAMHDVLRRLNS